MLKSLRQKDRVVYVSVDSVQRKEVFNMDIQFMCEVLGTAAFSISGAIMAIKHKMDIFGVVVLGIVTALGGGFLRDIILNISPPSLFVNTTYLSIATFSALLVFYVIAETNTSLFSEVAFNWLLNVVDAVGLAMFTAVGVNIAIEAHLGGYGFFCIFLGMLTGVGGGIIRDILTGSMPKILRKHIYAIASLLGATFYYYAQFVISSDYAMFISASIVITIRILADYYCWNLPKAN